MHHDRLGRGGDKDMDKYLSLISNNPHFGFSLVILRIFIIPLFFADKMSKISLDERKERLEKKMVERSGTSNPHNFLDYLNIRDEEES